MFNVNVGLDNLHAFSSWPPMTSMITDSLTIMSIGDMAQQRLRQQLPGNLDAWVSLDNEEAEKLWSTLQGVFLNQGYTLWPHRASFFLRAPTEPPTLTSGFGHVIPTRHGTKCGVGRSASLLSMEYKNALCRVARTAEGHDVFIRVLVVNKDGQENLDLLRRIATAPTSSFFNNHTLPMWAELNFKDVVFGIFPKVGPGISLSEMYDFWAKNSVGDVIEMIMQALEGLAFIHSLNIAHRDAFRDNFVIQWFPESLHIKKISPSRPRVYLIDFELAVSFPEDLPHEECLSIGYPLCGSVPTIGDYGRPPAPEFVSGKPYSPFKSDVWQLGRSLADFRVCATTSSFYFELIVPSSQSTIPAIDEILSGMTESDPLLRMSAQEALDRLGNVVHSMPPASLHIEPVVIAAPMPEIEEEPNDIQKST
ncbi:kinase-like domain-containing protein [Flammula alnicola]|nr:kinase-like domain-containing protein [Flammula alnicola]